MKKKYILPVAILLVVLAGVIIANVLLKKNQAAQEEAESIKAEEESLAAVINVIETKDIRGIAYNNGNTDLSFSKDGEDGDWVYDTDSAFPLNTAKIETIELMLEGLTASLKITDGDTLEGYGLDDPLEVTITDENGNKTTIGIGDMYDSQYYVLLNGDTSTVYRCTLLNYAYFSYDLYSDLVLLSQADYAGAETKIVITAGESKRVFTKGDKETTDDDGNTVTSSVWMVSCDGADAYEVTDTQTMDSFISALESDYTAMLAYNISDDELSAYGMDEPSYTMEITYLDTEGNEQTVTLVVGAYYEDSTADTYAYTIMKSGVNDIYTTDVNNVMQFMSASADDFIAEESETTEETTAEE